MNTTKVSSQTGFRFTVRLKLFFMNFVLIAIMIVTSAYGILSMNRMSQGYSALLQRQNTILTDTKSVEYYATHEVSLLREYFLLGASDDMSSIQSDNQQIQSLIKSSLPLLKSPAVTAKLQQALSAQQSFYAQVQQIAPMQDKKLALEVALKENLFENGVGITTEMKTANQMIRTNMTSTAQSQSLTASHTSLFMILATIVATLVSIVLGTYISTIISRSLKRLLELVSKVADGDLREQADIRTRDEVGQLGQSINQMITNLQHMIREVELSSSQVAASSEELMASSEQTSQATEHIASSMQEVASGSEKQVESTDSAVSTIREISTVADHVAANAGHVSDTAKQTTQLTQDGAKAILQVTENMASINEAVGSLTKDMTELGARSKKINDIVGVINQISSQTNLLALNAAIEAARAGDHGRGFAVVAEEVRKLAEQSAGSATQIINMVESIQRDTETAVKTTEAVHDEVKSGLQAVELAGASFKTIQQGIQEVAQQIQEVSAAIQQMSGGTKQADEAMRVISDIAVQASSSTQNVSAAAQEQLASMEEITASATSLSQMAEQLQDLISHFKL